MISNMCALYYVRNKNLDNLYFLNPLCTHYKYGIHLYGVVFPCPQNPLEHFHYLWGYLHFTQTFKEVQVFLPPSIYYLFVVKHPHGVFDLLMCWGERKAWNILDGGR